MSTRTALVLFVLAAATGGCSATTAEVPPPAIPEASYGRLAFEHGSDRIETETADWLPDQLSPCQRGPIDVELRVEAVASAELLERRRIAVQRSLALRGVPAEHVRFVPLALRLPEPPGAFLSFPPGCL